jgi:hypothetical protein
MNLYFENLINDCKYNRREKLRLISIHFYNPNLKKHSMIAGNQNPWIKKYTGKYVLDFNSGSKEFTICFQPYEYDHFYSIIVPKDTINPYISYIDTRPSSFYHSIEFKHDVKRNNIYKVTHFFPQKLRLRFNLLFRHMVILDR